MFLSLSFLGALVATGIVVPAGSEESDGWEDDEDEDQALGWAAWIRSALPRGSLRTPVVPLLPAERATPMELERFAFHGPDCETRWAVLTLTPEGRWLGAEQIPATRTRRYLDPELYDAILYAAEYWKDAERAPVCGEARPFEGDILVRVHPEVPTFRLRRALFSSGQAQFGRFWLQVDGADAGPRPEGPEDRIEPRWEEPTEAFLKTLIDHDGLPSFFVQGNEFPDDTPSPVEPAATTEKLPSTVYATPFTLGSVPAEGLGARPY